MVTDSVRLAYGKSVNVQIDGQILCVCAGYGSSSYSISSAKGAFIFNI